jgi:hypothetical protein
MLIGAENAAPAIEAPQSARVARDCDVLCDAIGIA